MPNNRISTVIQGRFNRGIRRMSRSTTYETRYHWFSASGLLHEGAGAVYVTPEGEEYLVSCVTSSPSHSLGFSDVVLLHYGPSAHLTRGHLADPHWGAIFENQGGEFPEGYIVPTEPSREQRRPRMRYEYSQLESYFERCNTSYNTYFNDRNSNYINYSTNRY